LAIVSLTEALKFLDISEGYFEIASVNDQIIFTSSEDGPITIEIPDGNYDGDDLATALQTAMNADDDLTGSGTITFAVSFSATTRKFTIDAGSTHTIAYTHAGSDAGLTLGFNENQSAAQTITSNIAAGDPTEIVETIRDSVEDWVQSSICMRNFESQSYSEKYDGRGFGRLNLKQYPITAVSRLSIHTRGALRIYNTNAYTTASVSVVSTGLVLILNGSSDETVLFATYTTLGDVVTAVNALGDGWYAELIVSDYTSYASTELNITYGRSCINSQSVYLNMPDSAEGDFTVFSNEGQIQRVGGFAEGSQNIRLDYTAGYTAALMPNDLKLAIQILIQWIYQKRFDKAFGVQVYSIDKFRIEYQTNPPSDARQILQKYTKVII